MPSLLGPVGFITAPGATGNQTYTLPASTGTVKAILLWWTEQAADGSATHAKFSAGMGTYRGAAVQQLFGSISSQSGPTSETAASEFNTNAIAVLQDEGTTTRDGEVTLVSLGTDQFVLNWTNIPTTGSVLLNYMCIMDGSGAVSDAFVGTAVVANATGQVDVALPAGFGQPDLIIALYPAGPDVNAGDPWGVQAAFSAIGMGACIKDGAQFASTWMTDDGSGSMDVGTEEISGSLVRQFDDSDPAVIQADFRVVASSGWPTDGFRIDRVTQQATTFGFLALKGTFNKSLTQRSTPTAAAPQNSDDALGFSNGQVTLLWGGNKNTAGSTAQVGAVADNAQWWIGAYDAIGNNVWAGLSQDQSNSASNSFSYRHSSKCIQMWAAATPTLRLEGVGSFSASNSRIAFSTTNATARSYLCLVIGYVSGPTTYTKTGSIVSAAAVAGADAVTFAETGAVVSAGALAGGRIREKPPKTGSIVSDGAMTGGSVKQRARTGLVVSAAAVAGADVSSHAETGAIISAAAVAGADVSEHVETGAVVSAGVVSGADSAQHAELGAIIAAAVLSGMHPSGVEYTKAGKITIGEDVSLLGSGAVDTVTKNGIVVDFDPPSGIDNVKEIRFDPTAPTYSAGLTVALPQGDSGAILTSPTGDMTDTIWDLFSANDDGFYSSVKNSAGNRWFSTNVRIGGMSSTVEPGVTPYPAADHGWRDGDNLWTDTTRVLINQDGGWEPLKDYAAQECIIENGQVWRNIGGGKSNDALHKPTFPSLTPNASFNTVAGDGDVAHGGTNDFIWSRLGEYLGVWAASTNFIPGIYNNGSSQPIFMLTPWITTPTHPDKLLLLAAHTGGTLAVTTAEPSWNAASSSRELYRDGNGIVWISGGSSLFGSNPTTHGGEKLVVTTLKAPTTNRIVKVTNAGASTTLVVLADHRNMTDFWGAQGYDVNGVWVGNQALPFGDRFVRNPTDVDGTAANRFQFAAGGTRKSERYIKGGESIYLIYNTTTGLWSEYVPSGASLSGAKQITLNKKNIVAATGVLSGSDKPENLKTGSIISAAVLAGDQVQTVSKTGSVISPAAVAGADVTTHAETGAIIAAGSMSGGRLREKPKTGIVISAAVVAGADVAEHSETGAIVSAGVVSGADVAEHVETGAVIAVGVVSGADVAQHAETGAIVSAAAVAGADVTSHAESGAIASDASVSGADVAQHAETGAIVSAAVLAGTSVKAAPGKSGSILAAAAVSGADAASHAETGAVVSDAKVSGGDAAEHTEAGSIKSDASVSGAGDAVRNKSGAVVSPVSLSASDVAEHSEAGAIVSAAAVSGADQVTHVETGTLISAAALSGDGGVTVSKQGSIVAAAVVAASDIFIATRSGVITAEAVIGASDQVIHVEIGSIISAAVLDGINTSSAVKKGAIVSRVILSGVSFHYVPPTASAGTRKLIIRAREGAILLSAGEDATLTSAEEEAHGLGSASFYSS